MPAHHALRLSLSALFICYLVLTGCSSNSSTPAAPAPGTSASVNLVRASGPGNLETRLKSALIDRYRRDSTRSVYTGGVPSGGSVSGTGAQSPATGASSPAPAFSGTNVQVAGVDEGDIVKTDGSFIYLARGTRLLVLKATPPEQTMIVSNIDLHQPIQELELVDGQLTVVTMQYQLYTAGTLSSPDEVLSIGPATRLLVYDVSSPASPQLQSGFVFPGSYQAGRRIGSRIFLVTNYGLALASPAQPADYLPSGSGNPVAFAIASAKALAENIKAINSLSLADLMPLYTVLATGPTATDPVELPLTGYGDIYFPETSNGTDLSLVIAVDLSGNAPSVSASGVVSSWCRVYMNQESLYLASGNEWQWIMPMDSKAAPEGNQLPRTAVHKFSVSDKPAYRSSGVVDGWLNDRFSMDEHLGYLRIGTTSGGWWGESISNQVAVLKEDGDRLVEAGKITGIAPGERIYSMRFDNDRGYLVTFKQTDPLFTLDLADPANPGVAGEITVSGFATYIHLLGGTRDRLLTIGRSTDGTGRVIGNKLQLFDVADLASPKLIGEYELGPGWSSALYDSHAFLSYESLGLLAIPYFSYTSDGAGYRSGLNVFSVAQNGITLKGLISAPSITSGYAGYPDTVDRSVIIGSSIYSIAHRSVTVAGADQVNTILTVAIPEGYAWFGTGGGVGGSGTGVVTGGTTTMAGPMKTTIMRQ